MENIRKVLKRELEEITNIEFFEKSLKNYFLTLEEEKIYKIIHSRFYLYESEEKEKAIIEAIKKIFNKGKVMFDKTKIDYNIISSETEWQNFIKQLKNIKEI